MFMRVPLVNRIGRFAATFSVYASTLDSSDEIKEPFYCSLRNALLNVPREHTSSLSLGAHVGRESFTWYDRKVN